MNICLHMSVVQFPAFTHVDVTWACEYSQLYGGGGTANRFHSPPSVQFPPQFGKIHKFLAKNEKLFLRFPSEIKPLHMYCILVCFVLACHHRIRISQKQRQRSSLLADGIDSIPCHTGDLAPG